MRYFLLQIKRVCRALPFLLITTLVLTGVVGLLAVIQSKTSAEDDGRQKIRLAVVGDTEDEFVKNGISLLQEMDSSRYTCTIEEMSEEEAQRALKAVETAGNRSVPGNFLGPLFPGAINR